MESSIYITIVAVCSLIILSYVFSIVSKKTRLPSILLLLATGVAIREVLVTTGNYIDVTAEAIELVGVIGLILILLEAGLDLEFSRGKAGIIKKAASSSLLVLFLSVLAKAAVLHYLLDASWLASVVFAVPLSIVSSAVVSSSIHILSKKKREFLTYETAVSDTAGILLFEYLIGNDTFGLDSIVTAFVAIVFAAVASVAFSLLLFWLAAHIRTLVKSFLMLAFLLLVYAGGVLLHLPSHLTVVIFALMISNWNIIRRRWKFSRTFDIGVKQLTGSLKLVTAETSFLMRTFFFTLFGYTIDIRMLTNPDVFLVGGLLVLVIYGIRFMYLRVFAEEYIIPELFFAPRGLVTVLLFYHIPEDLYIRQIGGEIIFFVILVTTLVMMIGSFLTPREASRAVDEE